MIRRLPGSRRLLTTFAIVFLLIPTLAACGLGSDDDDDSSDRTGQIEWVQGEPAGDLAEAPGSEGFDGDQVPAPEPEPTLPPTEAPVEPTTEAAPGSILTADQLAQYEPNEVGMVPVLMYHNIVPAYGEGQEGDVLWRTIGEFRADLEWLYERDFYVVPFYDYLTNNIKAPAGKYPVVLTFDDSRPNQFYFIENGDGSVDIDPNSAVGIMEEFFDAHPDFGRTAFFSILPIWCFDFEEPGQTQYCDQKLDWLVANGYEIGNHTWDHQDLTDVPNSVFQQKIVDASDFLEGAAPEGTASRILILPFGNFPSGDNAEQQWDWIRNGFTYEGREFTLQSVVAAGADPAPSPASINFDTMSIARIGAKDFPSAGEPDLFFDFWFGQFEANPGMLYRSDGNPDVITVPSNLVSDVDEDKIIAAGKQIVTY